MTRPKPKTHSGNRPVPPRPSSRHFRIPGPDTQSPSVQNSSANACSTSESGHSSTASEVSVVPVIVPTIYGLAIDYRSLLPGDKGYDGEYDSFFCCGPPGYGKEWDDENSWEARMRFYDDSLAHYEDTARNPVIVVEPVLTPNAPLPDFRLDPGLAAVAAKRLGGGKADSGHGKTHFPPRFHPYATSGHEQLQLTKKDSELSVTMLDVPERPSSTRSDRSDKSTSSRRSMRIKFVSDGDGKGKRLVLEQREASGTNYKTDHTKVNMPSTQVQENIQQRLQQAIPQHSRSVQHTQPHPYSTVGPSIVMPYPIPYSYVAPMGMHVQPMYNAPVFHPQHRAPLQYQAYRLPERHTEPDVSVDANTEIATAVSVPTELNAVNSKDQRTARAEIKEITHNMTVTAKIQVEQASTVETNPIRKVATPGSMNDIPVKSTQNSPASRNWKASGDRAMDPAAAAFVPSQRSTPSAAAAEFVAQRNVEYNAPAHAHIVSPSHYVPVGLPYSPQAQQTKVLGPGSGTALQNQQPGVFRVITTQFPQGHPPLVQHYGQQQTIQGNFQAQQVRKEQSSILRYPYPNVAGGQR